MICSDSRGETRNHKYQLWSKRIISRKRPIHANVTWPTTEYFKWKQWKKQKKKELDKKRHAGWLLCVYTGLQEIVACSYPFRNLDIHHEEVHVFLSFVQRQLLCNDCNQHGGAGNTLKPKTHRAFSIFVVVSTDCQRLCKTDPEYWDKTDEPEFAS